MTCTLGSNPNDHKPNKELYDVDIKRGHVCALLPGMTPWLISSIQACQVHPLPRLDPGLPLLCSKLPYSMAAPKAAARGRLFRTTEPPLERDLQPRPPSSRKFPFETEAADTTGCLAVAPEPLLNDSDKDCEPERRASEFVSPGARDWAECGGGWGGAGWRRFFPDPEPGLAGSSFPSALQLLGLGPALHNIHLAPSRAQPCRLVTMTSVVKTVYSVQPPSVLSGGLPAGGCTHRPQPRSCGPAIEVRPGVQGSDRWLGMWGAEPGGPPVG